MEIHKQDHNALKREPLRHNVSDPAGVRPDGDDAGEEWEEALARLGELLGTLHPSLYRSGAVLWGSLRELFRQSRRLWEEGPYWRYAVTEPEPARYGLRAETRTEAGWRVTAESRPFTGDPRVARTAAEIFTRNALSPIHLEDALQDFLDGI